MMIVSIHIKNESGDSYSKLFVDETVEQIKEQLYDNMEMYETGCDYELTFYDNSTDIEQQKVEDMLSKWCDDSWERNEED